MLLLKCSTNVLGVAERHAFPSLFEGVAERHAFPSSVEGVAERPAVPSRNSGGVAERHSAPSFVGLLEVFMNSKGC